MKNAAVATTTSSGAAVSSSRITAVQSVYIVLQPTRVGAFSQLNASARPRRPRRPLAPALAGSLGLLLSLTALPLRADVVFENCQPQPDGGITCDTRPTGNTLMDDEAARFGLLQQASPGWNEFDPYEGDDDMFGGNET